MADASLRRPPPTRSTPETALQALRAQVRGTVVTPSDEGYDAARAVWNAMIDRRPAVIVRCAGVSDVIRSVAFAREHELPLAVRGGGHNIAGNGVCDEGLVIDLSAMRAIRVDPQARTARVEPGATLADFDHEAQAFGLATPLGINSTTGVAGLTLGGGFGWLTRKYGMTVDSLLGADLVTAEGQLVRLSERENRDLFWAIRGGGGNFGVVTSFEFRLHPVGPEVYAGFMVHSMADAPRMLRHYRDFVVKAPEELSVWAVLRKAPPLPFLPEEHHGREVLILAACYLGSPFDGERHLAPLRRQTSPLAELLGPTPYAGFQQAFDPLLAPGARNYWKSHDLEDLPNALLDTVLDHAGRIPGPHCEILLAHLGGAAGRVPTNATAYAGRDADFVLNVHARWEDAGEDDRCIAWAREIHGATAPFSTGGVYVNFLTADEAERVPAAYGGNLARLVEVKREVDPRNLFSVNQNIAPRGMAP